VPAAAVVAAVAPAPAALIKDGGNFDKVGCGAYNWVKKLMKLRGGLEANFQTHVSRQNFVGNVHIKMLKCSYNTITIARIWLT
jgi:hypothetical protein